MASFLRSAEQQNTSSYGPLFKFIIAALVVGLGLLLGLQFTQSTESAELVVSIVVILLLLPIVIANPLNGVLLILILNPFIESIIEIPLGDGIPDLSFTRFMVAFLGISMLARAATGKFQFATPVSFAEVCIVATTIGLMISAPLAAHPVEVLQNVLTRFFVPLFLYFLARNLVKSREDLHKLMGAMVLFGFTAAIYAIYEQASGVILFVGDATVVEDLNTVYTDNLRLIRGLLGRSGNFGRVFATTIPVAFYLFFERKEALRKILMLLVLIVQFYALYLTFNRTSWYAVLISLSIIQFFYPQFRRAYIIIVIVAGVALWANIERLNDSAVVQERVNDKTEDYNGRTPRWEAGFNMWKEKPIRGWGFERFNQESGRYRTDGIRKNLRAIENDYLDIMVASGLIGFLPYLLFLVVPLVTSLRLFVKARSPDWVGFIKPETITIYWCVIIAFAMTSYTQAQTQPIVRMLPFVLAGAVIGTHQRWYNHKKQDI